MSRRESWERTTVNDSFSPDSPVKTVWTHSATGLEYLLERNYDEGKKWVGILVNPDGEEIHSEEFNSDSKAYAYLMHWMEMGVSEEYSMSQDNIENQEAMELIEWRIDDEEIISDCRNLLQYLPSGTFSSRMGKTVASAVVYYVISEYYDEIDPTQQEIADHFSCTRTGLWNTLDKLREYLEEERKQPQ